MTRHEEIRRSYKELGGMANIYDGIITRSTLLGKLMDGLIWGLDGELSARWIEDALAPIPSGFSGRLLEVPVGTGVLTMPLYASLPKADVICLDYSADMMANAKKRASAMGLTNVAFVQGDVGALPFADESFDLVLASISSSRSTAFTPFPTRMRRIAKHTASSKRAACSAAASISPGVLRAPTSSSGICTSPKASSPRPSRRSGASAHGCMSCIQRWSCIPSGQRAFSAVSSEERA